MMYNIKDMLKGKTVKFVKYHNGDLYYSTECGFEFPVPISDTGAATFLSEDKAMMFMRWVRKEITVATVKLQAIERARTGAI